MGPWALGPPAIGARPLTRFFFGGFGFPVAKMGDRKKNRYPHSKLCTGGPRGGGCVCVCLSVAFVVGPPQNGNSVSCRH